MAAERWRSQRIDPGELDETFDGVMKWKGISASDKIAWYFLWRLSRCGREQIATTAADIGACQKTTDDTGHTRVENLKKAGLVIVVSHDKLSGVYLLELPNPRDVAASHKVAWDQQKTLDFFGCSPLAQQSTSEPTAVGGDPDCTLKVAIRSEEPPEEPREEPRTPPLPLREAHSAPFPFVPLTSCIKGTMGERTPARGIDRGTSGGTSEGARPMAALLADRLDRLSDPVLLQRRIDQLAQEYFERVRCPMQRMSPCIRLATAVLQDRIKAQEVAALFATLNDPKSSVRIRSAYFNGSLKKMFARAGLDWSAPNKPR